MTTRCSITVFLTLCIRLSISICSAARLPYPVQPVDGNPVSFSLINHKHKQGDCSLQWDRQYFYLHLCVVDDNLVSLKKLGLSLKDMYRADSVEFWINRHQFGIVGKDKKSIVYDYLYQREIEDVIGTWEETPKGYQVKVKMPWKELGINTKPYQSFQFALQVNDRQKIKSDDRWKDVVKQTLYPTTATWDRPSTYGTVFLNENLPVNDCLTSPQPFIRINIRQWAYAKRVDALIQRIEPFKASKLLLKIIEPRGSVFRTLDIPAGTGEQLIRLPWNEKISGIFKAAVYLLVDGREFGPITENYFNGGQTTIAKYKSSRQPPEDLEEFWQKKISAMRSKPFNEKILKVDNPWSHAVVEKVQIDNHRGYPMIVFITRHREDGKKKLPTYLNVYPPMHSAKPLSPRKEYNLLTFCGSLQGDARLSEQKRNETLWARAESLDDCYWLDVILDGVRALDYVAAKENSNGKAIVTGGSRGGWYSFALAAVAPDRVTFARFASPCYSDVTMNMQLGYSSAATEICTTFERDRVKTNGRIFQNFRYFDPLFLAKLVKTRMLFSAGLRDNICSAIGMTAAANNITYKKVYFILDPEGHHGGSPYTAQFYNLIYCSEVKSFLFSP